METQTNKKERIDARLTSDQKALIQRAAALEGRSVSEFVVAAAADAAEKLVEQRQIVTLSIRDHDRFMEALSKPPKLSPAMERAFDRHARRVNQA